MGQLADDARALLAEAIGVGTGAVKLARETKEAVINLFVVDALITYGLELERGDALTAEALALAVNRKIFAEYGIDVGNLLDADSVRSALKKEALRAVGERLGVEGGSRDIAAAFKSSVRNTLLEAVASGDAEVLSAISVGQRAIEDAVRNSEPNLESQQVKNTSEAGEKNRERQARYRAAHKRVWVAK